MRTEIRSRNLETQVISCGDIKTSNVVVLIFVGSATMADLAAVSLSSFHSSRKINDAYRANKIRLCGHWFE